MLNNLYINLLSKYSNDVQYIKKCWSEIENAYNDHSRHYHNLRHLTLMFEELENVKNDIDDLDSFKLSVFYHDIIYDATANDNEKQSAILMQKHLSKTSFTNIQKCSEQIEATKRHEKSSHLDTNYLLDIDLAILGENESVYENYCNQIRNEYKMYSNRQYYHGRILVLQNLLSSDTIFKTAYFRNIYEKRAKNNLQNEILLLNKKMKKLS